MAHRAVCAGNTQPHLIYYFTMSGMFIYSSCVTATNLYVWGLDLSGQAEGRASPRAEMLGASGVGGLLAAIPGAQGFRPAYYPCHDANGNVTEYVDGNGVTAAHYAYDAYGNTTVKSGPMADDFNFRFSAKYFDAETGNYYYIKRHYSPALGRFISQDPIGISGGLNLYGFCGNDPINHVDTLGMSVFPFILSQPTPSPAPQPSGNQQPEDTCGPDVTAAVNATLADISRTFQDVWSTWEQCKACASLHKDLDGGWDIHPLKEWSRDEWTVQFRGKIYHAGAVNFAMWGRTNKLCYDTFRLPVYSLPGALGVMDAWKMVYFGAQGMETEAFVIYGYTGYLPFIRTLPVPWIGRPWSGRPPSPNRLPPLDWTWRPNKFGEHKL
ncbi:MAG: RHS repeat-associated core domain-containing protein [Kiritimatiellaeota bacterium]|nr:RHS repeat-associated core domain-containing protein [Kiritimatiellota bacterium]